MVSKHRPFPRNIHSLGNRAKKDLLAKISFFKVISKYRPFHRNIDSLGDRDKKQFFMKKSILSK